MKVDIQPAVSRAAEMRNEPSSFQEVKEISIGVNRSMQRNGGSEERDQLEEKWFHILGT